MFGLGKSSYSELVKKYDNFQVPAMVLEINNIPISKIPGLNISQVDVQLGLEGACSASITIEDIYDLESRSIHAVIKANCKLGNILTIELGYGSSTQMVFYGYMHEISYSYSDAPSISITALDMQKLMMLNYEKETYNDMSCADIFKKVVSKYSGIYKSLKVDPMLEQEKLVVKEISDYDFVKKVLCQKAKKIFYVMGGDVYFETRGKNPLSVLTLAWGEGLFNFQFSKVYANEEIVVYGVEGKKIISISEKIKTESTVKSLTSTSIKKEIAVPETDDKKKLERIAESEAEKKKAKSKIGRGSCIGLPELEPGRYLTIENLGIESGDLKGYIVSVKHSFGSNGFTTDFELGGD